MQLFIINSCFKSLSTINWVFNGLKISPSFFKGGNPYENADFIRFAKVLNLSNNVAFSKRVFTIYLEENNPRNGHAT
ncbi:hypothetical protein THII_1047 [Thioploca ingrica]|uniref:Uncharacterized protein n=1 Tax=Thioploca ingrica TaxID=40754 RepID=A0A090AEJ5_9GAMM|nr:hypothetical protein THII_1047 [Thioploca ingrica]